MGIHVYMHVHVHVHVVQKWVAQCCVALTNQSTMYGYIHVHVHSVHVHYKLHTNVHACMYSICSTNGLN